MLYQPEPEALFATSAPHRILIVSDAWTPQVNGVVRTLRTVAQELRKMGKIVEVVGPERFRTLPMPSYPEIRLSVLPNRKLARIIEEFRPDALHIATEGPLGMAARRYAIRYNMPFTTAFHTRFAEYLKARTGIPEFLSYAWLRRFHGAGSAVMVATQSLREELLTRGFKNVRPWSRGVDLDAFSPAVKESLDLPRPVFLYVGRVAVEKNLRAFLALDLPGSKVVVGDGPQRAELQAEFPQAHFVGTRHGAALAAAYAGADVFVFPSKTDTFGLVVLEALASGLPVAAYPVTGPKDILAEAQKPVGALDEDLRQACLKALEIDRAACRPFAETYSWRACAERFLDNLVPVGGGIKHKGLCPLNPTRGLPAPLIPWPGPEARTPLVFQGQGVGDAEFSRQASLGEKAVEMAHFAARAGFRLAVMMRDQPRRGEDARPQRHVLGADKVLHHGIGMADGGGQRQPGHGTDMHLELAARAGIHGPMPGIMRARGDLVHQQRALRREEHLHAENPHQLQPLRDPAGDLPGLGQDIGGSGAGARVRSRIWCLWRFSTASNATTPPSTPRATITEISAAKSTKPFQHQGLGREARKGGAKILSRAQHGLALAVIAQPRGFQHRGQAEAGGGRFQLRQAFHLGPRRGGDAGLVEKAFLQKPVLAEGQNPGAGADGFQALQQGQGVRRGGSRTRR